MKPKLKQKHVAQILDIPVPLVSMIITGKRQISWNLAERMAKLFPYRNISEWKKATPEQFLKAFTTESFSDLLSITQTMKTFDKA